MRSSRLLSILILLQTRGRMTAHALAATFEVSVRTIYRDINDPFGGSMNVYRQVRNELEPLVNRLVLKLTNDGSKVTKPPRRLPKKTGE